MAKFILTKKTKRLIVSFKNQYSIIPLFRPQGNYGSIEEILYFQYGCRNSDTSNYAVALLLSDRTVKTHTPGLP